MAGSVNEADECGGEGKAGENEEGEVEAAPPPHPPSSAAQPVKTLPRPAYEGDKEALIKVCQGSGDVDEARDLIARGIDIDELDEYGTTALMWAALNNRLEMVQELIRAGAAPEIVLGYEFYGLDVQNHFLQGMTALQLAQKRGRTEIATFLREVGARCPGYERSGWFNSTCKWCGGSKAGRWHDEA